MSDQSYNYLLEVVRDHDISVDESLLKRAFNDPKSQTAVRAWVEEYISPETILTKEEATLYGFFALIRILIN